MKILVAALHDHNSNYAQSAINSLQYLGNNIKFVPMINFSEQCTYLERKLYKFGADFIYLNYKKNWNKKVIEVCNEFQPDTILAINAFSLTNTTLIELKKRKIKLVLWMFDSIKRQFMKELEDIINYFNIIFCFEETDLIYLKNKYSLNSYYCPVGFDENIYYPDANISKDIDICFIGTGSKERFKILQPVADYAKKNALNLKIFGKWWLESYFWKKLIFAKKYTPLSEYICNNRIDPVQTADLYRRSKICLNIHISDHTNINPRTFEILGTRSFELMDERKNTDGLIRPGTDLVMYNDIDDLLDKIKYYLANEKERENIAANGYEWVKERYTMKHIVKNIMEKCFI